MEKKLIRKITIKCFDVNEQMTIGNFICDQLRSNKDFIDNNIVLCFDVKDVIRLYFYEGCKEIPTIMI